MQVSHSRIEIHEKCPFKYKLRYVDKVKTIPDDAPDNALYLGTAIHTGLDKGVQAAIDEYFSFYPIISDQHITETMKLEALIPKARKLLPEGEFEVEISNDDFIGFIDFLTPTTAFRGCEVPNSFDLWDFKYSNNQKNYADSPQLHLYKYYFEKLNPGKVIKNLKYLFIPKVNLKQKKSEDLMQFRRRILEELKSAEPSIVPVEYDQQKVLKFFEAVKKTLDAKDFPTEPNYLCNYCEYQDYCQKGIDYMLLPSKERRNIERVEKKVIWLYGSPFSGKTTFANKFPDPLMLNTDGNIKFVDAPYISIKDEIKLNGRMTSRKFAWEIFKESIDELEKKQNEFKTIIVDLLEDTYEHCRLYMYDQMGISHESDDSFRAWDKVRTEFLSTLKRLINLDYENIILISHEDTSKDITKKGGDKLTSIKPNLNDKVANKVAGMVDIVFRVIADDQKRVLSFKTSEVIFGGGRLTTDIKEIDLDYDAFLAVYEEANKAAVAKMKGSDSKRGVDKAKTESGSTGEQGQPDKVETGRRGRRSSEVEETKPEQQVVGEGHSESKAAEMITNNGSEASIPEKSESEEIVDQIMGGEAEIKSEPEKVEPAVRTRKRRGE